MFQITPAMLAAWQAKNDVKATAADVAALEASLGVTLPTPYVEFVTQYGCVVFGRDAERRCLFTCAYASDGQTEVRRADVSFLRDLGEVALVYRNMAFSDDPDDDSLPSFPSDYLPVGSDAGQGAILLELRPEAGRVWYWRESEWAWGREDNTRLGYVADDFYGFINGLQPDPL